MVYKSAMYAAFLKQRVAAQVKKAQEDKIARPALLPVLQESIESVEMSAELQMVATLGDTTLKLKQKLDLLWSNPNASQIISKWAGLSDAWAKYMPFSQNARWPQAYAYN